MVSWLNLQQTMTSIAQVMPPDIVCEIFVYFGTCLNANNPENFPWYLGHICSQWRTALLSMGPHELCVFYEGHYWASEILYKEYENIVNVETHFLELNRDRQFYFSFW